MPKPNPLMYVVSGRLPMINRRKVTGEDRRYASVYGKTFHDTWEEAHAALIARLEKKVERATAEAKQAARWAHQAERQLAKARALRPPEGRGRPISESAPR